MPDETMDDLLVCRCEEITGAAVAVAIAEGARTLSDVRRRTRAGMGLCQGRWCGHALAALIAAQTGVPLATLAPLTARPPARPVSLGVLADLEERG